MINFDRKPNNRLEQKTVSYLSKTAGVKRVGKLKAFKRKHLSGGCGGIGKSNILVKE